MTEVETEFDSRYDDIDVDSILARCQRQGPLTFSRKRCLYQAPEFIKRLPSTEEVQEGSTVTFACKVVGFPDPTITWYKDDDMLTSDSRAKTDSEDAGIHSIQIEEVSKCDAGIYKIHASNLEGSSKSMLYISVKARYKRRNKKKKKTGNVACGPLFPVIIERVAEEQKEMLEIQLQPESPLTPLYCTISRKAPVMWPAFLGDWAYNEDEVLHRGEIDDLGAECDDVFNQPDSEEGIHGGLTFVSSAYAQMKEPTEVTTNSDDNTGIIENDIVALEIEGLNTIHDIGSDQQEDEISNENTNTKETLDSEDFLGDGGNSAAPLTETNENDCDILNNNGTVYANKETSNYFAGSDESNKTYQVEQKQRYCDPNAVSSIAVHRSYAKGDTTSSVARRSPSPFSRTQHLMTYTHNGLDPYQDTTTLQNLNNERILHRMNQKATIYHRFWDIFRSVATSSIWEDDLEVIILLICGSTFLALCLDLPPTTFMLDIIVAMIVKLVLMYVFEDK